jgi:hypothetical protein
MKNARIAAGICKYISQIMTRADHLPKRSLTGTTAHTAVKKIPMAIKLTVRPSSMTLPILTIGASSNSARNSGKIKKKVVYGVNITPNSSASPFQLNNVFLASFTSILIDNATESSP